MDQEYYTVEQISAMLSIHPKTIQRYIRQGKLYASKIGKGWRITGHDLSVFTKSAKKSLDTHSSGSAMQPEDRVKVSSVIDIDVDDRDDAIRIVNTLSAALNVKPPEYGRSTMNAQFLETEYKVRVTLWGNIPFMSDMFSFISALTE